MSNFCTIEIGACIIFNVVSKPHHSSEGPKIAGRKVRDLISNKANWPPRRRRSPQDRHRLDTSYYNSNPGRTAIYRHLPNFYNLKRPKSTQSHSKSVPLKRDRSPRISARDLEVTNIIPHY